MSETKKSNSKSKGAQMKSNELLVLPVEGHFVLDLRRGSGFENQPVKYIGQTYDHETKSFIMTDEPVRFQPPHTSKKQHRVQVTYN